MLKTTYKKINIIFFITSFFLTSCVTNSKLLDNNWSFSSDKMLAVNAQKEGIYIEKNISSNYKNIQIHVEPLFYNKKTKEQIADTTSVYIKAQTDIDNYLYPFVKKGQNYQIYLTMTNKKTNKYISSKPINIIAVGGIGDCKISSSVTSKSYNSQNYEVTFNSLKLDIPVKYQALPITGYIYSNKTNIPHFHNDFILKDKKMNLKPIMAYIRNCNFYLDLTYSFNYNNTTFAQTLINNYSNFFTDTNSTIIVKNTKLPAVYIETQNNKDIASREKYQKVNIKFNNTSISAQIKGRGNSSWGRMPKHSYSIKFDKKASVLGFKEGKKWVLVSNYSDKTLIRNQYVSYIGQNIFNKMMWNPSFKQVDLYINNEYQGTYIFGEKIDVAKNKINIQLLDDIKKDINKDKTLDIYDGGFVVEMNRREDEFFNFRTTHDVSISLKEPDKCSVKLQKRVQKVIQQAENAIFSKNFDDPINGYAKYIDVDSFIDWYLINEFSKNVDSAWFSSIYIVYDPKDCKLHLGPLWDYDLGFGNINYNDCDNPYGFWIQKRGIWFNRLFKDPAFKEKVKKRWNDKKSVLLKSIDTQIDILFEEVLESSYYNFDVWPILGTFVWPNADGYENRLTIQSEIEYLKNWCKIRYNWMDNEIQKW